MPDYILSYWSGTTEVEVYEEDTLYDVTNQWQWLCGPTTLCGNTTFVSNLYPDSLIYPNTHVYPGGYI